VTSEALDIQLVVTPGEINSKCRVGYHGGCCSVCNVGHCVDYIRHCVVPILKVTALCCRNVESCVMLEIVWGVMLGVVLGIVVVSMLHVVECSEAMCFVKFPV
jgi:hypothetical protein